MTQDIKDNQSKNLVDWIRSCGPDHHTVKHLWSTKQCPKHLDELPVVKYYKMVGGVITEVSKKEFGPFDPTLPVYTDGSCMHPTDPALAVAAAAVVQTDWDGNLIKVCTQVVPLGVKATAAVSEHMAIVIMDELADEPQQCWVDCASVVTSAANTVWARLPERPFGGMWKTVTHTHTVMKT